MINEAVKLHGSLTAVLRKADGRTIVRRKDNLIVNVGFDFISDAMCLSPGRPSVMSHIGIGTGAVAPTVRDNDLGTEIYRKAAAYSHRPNSKTFTMQMTADAGQGTGAITEAGVFNASSAGLMLDRVMFAVINKATDDTLTLTFTFTMS